MKILVYGINYSPELTGIGKYTGEMVEWMAEQGHDVRVITAPPYYPEWQVGARYSGRLALPVVCANTAVNAETFNSSRQFCLEQLFPVDGAASLET